MDKTTLIALVTGPGLYIAIGLIGSGLEKLGTALAWPRLEAFGKVLEAIASDVPKALSNGKTLLVGAAKALPAAILLLCLGALTLTACPPGTGGGSAGSGGSSSDAGSLWPDVAKCAPNPGDLIGEVTQILLSGGDYETALEQEAIKDGGAAVVCAVNTLVRDWTAPGAARNALRTDALTRGQAFLAHVPTKVQAAQ